MYEQVLKQYSSYNMCLVRKDNSDRIYTYVDVYRSNMFIEKGSEVVPEAWSDVQYNIF